MGEAYSNPVSGGAVAAGRHYWPAWRRTMLAGTWAAVGSNTLQAIDPEDSPAYNPNYPDLAPWHGISGQIAVVDAWGTATWDDARKRLAIPLGGGHGNYAGNEGYHINLGSDTPAFELTWAPSITDYMYGGQDFERLGLYPDGRLRSAHAYNNLAYVPGLGNVCCRIIGMYQSGQTENNNIWTLSEDGTPTLRFNASPYNNIGWAYGGFDYDPTRRVLWCCGTSAGYLYNVSVDTWQFTRVGGLEILGTPYNKVIYCPDHDVLISYDGTLRVWDIANGGGMHLVTIPESWPNGFEFNGTTGGAWAHGKLWLWHNTSETPQIYTLTPGADVINDPWTFGYAKLAPENAVTPSSCCGNGTFGKFGYSAALDGFYLLNAIDQPVYFYAVSER